VIFGFGDNQALVLSEYWSDYSQSQVNCWQETRSATAEPYLNVPLKASTGSTNPHSLVIGYIANRP
jgi:hypothetical protein